MVGSKVRARSALVQQRMIRSDNHENCASVPIAKTTKTPSLFDDDDDDDDSDSVDHIDDNKESNNDVYKDPVLRSAKHRSFFDDDDDGQPINNLGASASHNDISREDLDAADVSDKELNKEMLIALVVELRQEIAQLRAEMAILKCENIQSSIVNEAEASEPVIILGKDSRPRAAISVPRNEEWDRLAQEEKLRRTAKRGAIQRRTKRHPPSKTSTSVEPLADKPTHAKSQDQKEDSSQHTSQDGKPITNIISDQGSAIRKDSFFDASSSEDEVSKVSEDEDFEWDEDGPTEQPPFDQKLGLNNVLNSASTSEEQLRIEVEAATLTWARGKDIISMIASVHVVFSGELSHRLPSAWMWNGTDVADRSSIQTSEIRKAYLRIVRLVHPDKQSHSNTLVKLQANAVFTALSDAFTAARL